MSNFMIAYYGGKQPASKEEGMAQMEKWKTWIGSLGDTIVNPGTPLPASKIVTSNSVADDSDPNAMKGFAVVKADSMDAAGDCQDRSVFRKWWTNTRFPNDGDVNLLGRVNPRSFILNNVLGVKSNYGQNRIFRSGKRGYY